MGSQSKNRKSQCKPRSNVPHARSSSDKESSMWHTRAPSKKTNRPEVNKIDKFSWLLYIAVSVVLGTITFYYYQKYKNEVSVQTPLPSPKIIADNLTSAAVTPERFWGTYRPQNYFGMKTRSIQSAVVGLMWFTQSTVQGLPNIRHWCNQEDKLPRYTWLAHDGTHFGEQEIMDQTFILRTGFVKRSGGEHGGDWTASIRALPYGKKEDTNKKLLVSLLFYVALDGQGFIKEKLNKHGQMIGIEGETRELGHFRLTFTKSSALQYNFLSTWSPGLHVLLETVIKNMGVFQLHKASQRYFGVIGRNLPEGQPEVNFIAYQVTFQLPYELEIVFESGSNTRHPNSLTGSIFADEFKKYYKEFDQKFERVFGLKAKGYTEDEVIKAKSILSNMIGGLGYFYGKSTVQSRFNVEPVKYWHAALYTGVPSRSFFPRGFLWDEGFHNLLISQWDAQISKEIIGHWLDLINIEGWIPREQILGQEARAKVPDQFIVQHNTNANPPTFFLPLQKLLKDMIASNNEQDKQYLKNLFPRLKAWYSWYNATQHGKSPFTYKWRGRKDNDLHQINPLTLTSGLDDYPRASHPTDDERHVDLYCWMVLASNIMSDIAKELGETHVEYESTYKILSNNNLLDNIHWSNKSHSYADFGLHSDKIVLVKPPLPKNAQPGQPVTKQDKIRLVQKEAKKQFVNSFGYVSLFPFFLLIVEPNSPKLEKILLDLNNTKLLWTRYGLRSLAKTAPLYRKHNTEHDPPYWRGQIWINMNYLAIRALNYYANIPGPYQNHAQYLYKVLRERIVQLVLVEFLRTGYVWENYDDVTGEGQGSHPFTGWSGLVVLIMAEKYD